MHVEWWFEGGLVVAFRGHQRGPQPRLVSPGAPAAHAPRPPLHPITGGHVLAWLGGPKHEDDSLETLKEDRRTGLAWLAVITAVALWCSAGDVSFK